MIKKEAIKKLFSFSKNVDRKSLVIACDAYVYQVVWVFII